MKKKGLNAKATNVVPVTGSGGRMGREEEGGRFHSQDTQECVRPCLLRRHLVQSCSCIWHRSGNPPGILLANIPFLVNRVTHRARAEFFSRSPSTSMSRRTPPRISSWHSPWMGARAIDLLPDRTTDAHACVACTMLTLTTLLCCVSL